MQKSRSFLLVLQLSFLFIAPLWAQDLDRMALYHRAQNRRAPASLEAATPQTADLSLLDVDRYPQEFAWYILSEDSKALEEAVVLNAHRYVARFRVDRQFGAGTGSGGATALTTQGGIVDFISGAFESGSLTRTVDGKSTTFTFNGENLVKFLTAQKLCDDSQVSCGVLHDFSAFGSFESVAPDGAQKATVVADGTTGKTQQVSFLPDSRTLTGAGFQWVLNTQHGANAAERFKQRLVANEALPDFQRRATITSAMTGNLESLGIRLLEGVNSDALRDVFAVVNRSGLTRALPGVVQACAGANQLDCAVEGMKQAAIASDQDLPNKLRILLRTAPAALAANRMFVLANQVQAASLRYDYTKPHNQAALHSVKAILKTFHQGTNTTITGNLALEFFDGNPQSGLRDLQISGALVRPLGGTSPDHPTFTLAGYYQYQKENAAIQFASGNSVQGITLPGSAATLLAPKGHIWIVQALLTLRKDNVAQIPLGVTYSNRTELLTGSEIRGQVGITFNSPLPQ